MDRRFDSIRAEIAGMRTELRSEIGAARSELRADIRSLHSDLTRVALAVGVPRAENA
jgi:hypothetical protein